MHITHLYLFAKKSSGAVNGLQSGDVRCASAFNASLNRLFQKREREYNSLGCVIDSSRWHEGKTDCARLSQGPSNYELRVEKNYDFFVASVFLEKKKTFIHPYIRTVQTQKRCLFEKT